MSNFTHLHLHTEYSLLDGVDKIDTYLDRGKELGMTAMAITDHGNLFGAIEFYKKARKKGIKPIIGTEAYVSEFEASNKEGRIFHLILLAKNITGYKNLMKISSFGYTEGFYYKPRVDKEFLKQHSDGLIALSACMQGEVSRRILDRENDEKIDSAVNEYIDIFGKDNFYIEVQANGIKEQYSLNDKLYELSKKHSLSLVATNDTHYAMKGEHYLQEIIICIQTGTKIDDTNRMKIETTGLYLKSKEEMLSELGEKYTEAIENSNIIADKCNIEIEFGVFKFPNYELPQGTTLEEYLKYLVNKGLTKRYPQGITKVIKDRIEYELSVIIKMGYTGYFIVVWDFIYFSRKKGIPIGPGRGSAAGSLVAYALGITQLDPLKYNLLFERFLNPERVSMPDIDIDICQERRQEVIEYVTEKYGTDKVAQIITFGTLKSRAVIRDVGRVLDVPLFKIDKLAKLIPQNTDLKEIANSSEEFKNYYENDEDLKKVVEISKHLEYRVRHASVHAAGIVITDEPLTNLVPLYSDNKSTTVSTQYQMKELEELGILKMDFLGLRNLTILQRTIDYIKEHTGETVILSDISLSKKEVYNMISKGDTTGVFQLESTGIRRVLIKLRPDRFEDIIAVLALYRPGPLGSGMVDDFINCKNGVSQIKYPDDSLKDILEETYGVILYQEQVMKIASKMAGYSLGEADLLRRAMGKKNVQIMQENKEKFIKGSIKNGYTKEKAEELFNLIDKFAGYGFNKSHSAAYALIAYWTAYFKYFYTKFYYAAILTSGMDHIENIAFYVADAKYHNVKLYLPNVNRAGSKFVVDKEGIVFSLAAIKNVGDNIAESIVNEYKTSGEYKSLEDFVVRNKKYGLNKKCLESLILSGALDTLPGNRKQKYSSIDKILDYAGRKNNEDEIEQMNLFGDAKSVLDKFVLPETPDFTLDEKLAKEKEYLGFYFSAHPLDKYKQIIDTYKLKDILSIKDDKTSDRIQTLGIIRDVKKIVTKKGDIMCTFVLEDYYDAIQGLVFPKTYKECAHILVDGKAVFISGYVQNDYFKNVESKKLIAQQLTYLEDIVKDPNFTVYILLQNEDKIKFASLQNLIRKNPGKVPVIFATKSNNSRITKRSEYKIQPSLEFISGVIYLLGENKMVIK